MLIEVEMKTALSILLQIKTKLIIINGSEDLYHSTSTQYVSID